jgi:hypothetical protein
MKSSFTPTSITRRISCARFPQETLEKANCLPAKGGLINKKQNIKR